jgi:mannose-6-phosphate isomerase-like protein (cupin superfamily)
MTQDPTRPRRLSLEELELLDIKVTREGGSVRYLEGARYGLQTSIYRSETVAGGGPPPHAHPYTEFFVIEDGAARFQVGGEVIEAGRGDVVIVPADVTHSFVNPGSEPLRQTAIHEAPAHAQEMR